MRLNLSLLPDQPLVDPVLEQSTAPAPGPRPRLDLSRLPDAPRPKLDLSRLPDADPQGDQFYDYAAAIAAGAKPDASGHWPSDFKKPGHPNEIVGGFNTRTGERVPGTPQASEQELVASGWDPATAKRLSTPEKSWWDWIAETAVPAAIRTVPAIGGGILGAAGGPLGVAGGGAAGAGLGELAAEGYEKWMGTREEINPLQVGVQTALGAVPIVGRAGSLAKTVGSRALQGAGLGAGADVATRLAEGQDINIPSTALSAAVGAGLGGGLGAMEARSLSRAAVKPSLIDELGPTPAATTTINGQGPKLDVSKLPDAPVMPAPNVGTIVPETGAAKTPKRKISLMAGTREIDADRVRPDAPEVVQLEAASRPDMDVIIPPDLDAVRPTSPLSTGVELAGRKGTELPSQRPIAESDLIVEDMARMFPEEHRPALMAIIEANGGFEDMRRGVQSNARTDALAEHLVVSRGKNVRGTILNAPQTKALANTITTLQDDISTMQAAAAAAPGSVSPIDLIRLAQKKQEVVTLMANHIGARAEVGRALQIHKTLGQALKTTDQQMLQDALRLPGVKNDPDFLNKWATATSDVERMNLIKSQQELSWTDAIVSYAISNMLSGPKTHLRNLFGTTSNAAFRLASSAAGVPYDIIMSKVTGRARTTNLRSTTDAILGATHGLREGLEEARFVLQNGYSRGATSLSPFDTTGGMNIPRAELKPLGFGEKLRLGSDPKHNPFNWPGRLLEAEDAMLAGIYRKMNQYGRISAKARTMFAGDNQKIAEMMADFKLRPDKYPEILREAEDETRRMLFREEPGQFSKGISNLKSKGGLLGKGLSFVIPFVKVPSNIMRQAAESTPLAPMSHDFRRIFREGTPREQADAAGRLLMGTSALATMAYWASQGKVSGPGPSDPRERAALMESGWRPNSMKVGNHWVDYTIPLQTIASPLSAIAAAWESFSEDQDTDSHYAKVTNIATALPRTVLDQSFLSGLSDFVSAMSRPEQYLASWGSRVGTSFVPLSGLQRNVAQTIDPVVRDAEGPLLERMGESVRSIIPGVSTTVDPRLTRFGEDATRNRRDAVLPANIVRESEEPLIVKLRALGIENIATPPLTLNAVPSQKIPEIRLTLDQRREIGQAQRRAVENAVRGMRVGQIDEQAARERIQRVVANARAEVAARIRARRTRE